MTRSARLRVPVLTAVALLGLVLSGCLPISTRHVAGPGMTTLMGQGSTRGPATVPRVGPRVDVVLMDMSRAAMTAGDREPVEVRAAARGCGDDGARPHDAAQRSSRRTCRSGDVRWPRTTGLASTSWSCCRSVRTPRSAVVGLLRPGRGRERRARRSLRFLRRRSGRRHRGRQHGVGHAPTGPWPIRAGLQPPGALRAGHVRRARGPLIRFTTARRRGRRGRTRRSRWCC